MMLLLTLLQFVHRNAQLGPTARLQAVARDADDKGWAAGNGWKALPAGVGQLAPPEWLDLAMTTPKQ